MHESTSDIALLRAWQRHGDAEAFHTLVQRHAGLVYNTCRRVVRNDEDAADVSQECFLSLATAPPDIQKSLPGFLHRLATHRALDHLKSANRRRAREARYEAESQRETDVPANELMEWVDEAIDQLPDELRIPIVEHFLHQKTHQEVADGIGVPRRTVSKRISRAVDEIREHLRARGALVSGATLLAFFEAQATEAAPVPATLLSALGKQAVAGSAGANAGTAATTGLLLKSGWPWAAAAVVACLAGWFLIDGPRQPAGTQAGATDAALPSVATQPDDTAQAVSPPEAAIAEPNETMAAATLTGADASAAIAGRVFDEVTNVGLPGVEVTATLSGTTRTAVSNERGEYRLENLAEGTATVTVSATEGFFPIQNAKQEVSLASGSVSFIDFGLKPGQFTGVSGIVVNESGKPVANATVTAWSQPYLGGTGQMREVQSEDDGTFEIDGLELDAALFLKARTSQRGCAPVGPLRLGNEPLLGQELALARFASVAGTVADAENNPANAGVLIRATLKNPTRESTVAYPTATGSFQIGALVPGSYELTVESRNEISTGIAAPGETVELGPDEVKRDVILVTTIPQQRESIARFGGPKRMEQPKSVGTIQGTIRDAVTGQAITEITLNVKEFRFGSKRDNTKEFSDGAGKYKLEATEAQSYVLTATASGYSPETIALYPEHFTPPVTTANFNLKRSAVVAGSIVDVSNSPVVGASVFLNTKPEELFMQLERNPGDTQSDADGRFILDSLGAGTSRIYVIHPSYAYAWTDVDPARATTLKPQVTLISGATIKGVVMNGDIPIVGQQVFCRYPEARDLGVYMATTDSEGRFRMEHAVPDYCEVYASLREGDFESRKTAWKQMTLSDEQVAEVTLQIQNGTGVLQGSIRLAGAKPDSATASLRFERGEASESHPGEYADGQYNFDNLPEGTATLFIGAESTNGVRYHQRLAVSVPTDAELIRNVDFSGTLVSIRSTGVAEGDKVSLSLYRGDVETEVEGETARLERNSHLLASIYESDTGNADISTVPPGTYTLRAELVEHDQGERKVKAAHSYRLEVRPENENHVDIAF